MPEPSDGDRFEALNFDLKIIENFKNVLNLNIGLDLNRFGMLYAFRSTVFYKVEQI